MVFRSGGPFTAESLANAVRLGEIAHGAQTYTYAPPDSFPYYYGVFAMAVDGSPYPVFLPSQNVTAQGISIASETASTEAQAQGATALPAQDSSKTASSSDQSQIQSPPQPFVSGIGAKAKGDSIVISYKASPKSRLVLYRGTALISGASDLLNATLVAAFTDKDGNFADYPVPGVDYYYALLGEEDLKAGKISIVPGTNTMLLPVQVSAGTISSGLSLTPPPSRTPPLPYFLMENGAADGIDLTEHEGLFPALPVSPETEKAVSALLAKAPEVKHPMPDTRLLPEELSPPSGGEDYALSLIVGDKIAAKDWAVAVDQLRKYLSLNRSPKASARAHFYLGESLTAMGSSRDAFFEFLSARDFYPIETKPWIDFVLSTLRESTQG